MKKEELQKANTCVYCCWVSADRAFCLGESLFCCVNLACCPNNQNLSNLFAHVMEESIFLLSGEFMSGYIILFGWEFVFLVVICARRFTTHSMLL